MKYRGDFQFLKRYENCYSYQICNHINRIERLEVFYMENQIGARVLTKQMMECSFAHTDTVLETIDKIRKRAADVHDEFENALLESPNEAVMGARGYNNAISILGSRGSGKTSIIMTLQHILQIGKEAWQKGSNPIKTNNIIMPLLVPQDFTPNQSLLSWVIIQLLEKAEQIEKEIANNNTYVFGSRGPFHRWMSASQKYPVKDPLRECMDNLTASFELRFMSENSLIGKDDQVYHYMDAAKRDSELILEMLKLISMMTDYYRNDSQYTSDNANKEEPLFFFCIDDLDLAPERSNETLKLVLRYLQHPNIVVLCGWNPELFQTHLCIELLKKQGALDSNLTDINYCYDDVFMYRQRKRIAALDSARRLAIDNLKKAFPPAQRYEIRSLTTKQRASFPIQADAGDSNGNISFFELIERTINCCISSEETPEKHIRFLYSRMGERLNVYMRIFDNKVRGMINVYRAFEDFYEHVKTWDHKTELPVTNHVKSLLDTILFSNTRFAPYRRGIRDLIRIDNIVLQANHSICEYYCDFKSVEKVLKDYDKRVEQQHELHPLDAEYRIEREYSYFPSLIIDVFLLLNFMENFVRYITKCEHSEHSGLVFSSLLNQVIPPVLIDIDANDSLSQAILTSGINVIPLFPQTDSVRLNMELLDSYEKHDFTDGQYVFNGGYSYCRLFDSFFYTVSKNGKIDEESLRFLFDRTPKWFLMITKLFSCLRYNDYNVKRRLVFDNLLSQGLYENQEEILQVVNGINNHPDNNFLDNDSEFKKTVTDIDMHNIITCLREADALRRKIKNCIIRKNRNLNPAEEDFAAIQRAEVFMGIFGYLYEVPVDEWLDAEALRQRLFDFRSYKLRLTDKREPNIELADPAIQLIDHMIFVLLSNLKQRMEGAVLINYQKLTDPLSQYLYLRSAARAISKYLQKWELSLGQWSITESTTCTNLKMFFQEKGFEEPFNIIRRIAQIGPKLQESNRSDYFTDVIKLKSWISKHSTLLSREELSDIRDSIKILETAPGHIRRLLAVDDQIYDLIAEFGKALACKYAEKGLIVLSETDSPRIWPFTRQNRERLQIWGNEIDRISSCIQKNNRLGTVESTPASQAEESSATMFDADFPSFEYSMILRGEKEDI